MLWFFLVAVAVVVTWAIRRHGVPRLVWPAEMAPITELSSGPSIPPQPERRSTDRMLLTAFRSDEFSATADAALEDQRILERALQLLSEHVGAAQAVLWLPDPEQEGTLSAIAWAPGGAAALLPEREQLLVALSATEQRSTYNAADASLRLLSVGAMLGVERGAISVHFTEQPTLSRTAITEWVTRHGRGIADLYDAVRSRAMLAMRTNKLRAMVRTATTLQGSRDPMALEQSLATDACVVTGAEWALIVRWNPVAQVGIPTHAGPGAPDFGVRASASAASLVGAVCASGMFRAFPDARPLQGLEEHLFDGLPLPSGVRSLCLVPLRRSETEAAIGALVLGHSRRGGLAHNDAYAAKDLGTIAAGALETAWAVKEATERARTDQLTGLPNRRAFDEQFARLIGETDRYGGSMALVLADIDFFKKVNDTYGHEAGDRTLKAVGAALAAERRTTDFVARLGGEELAVLLPQTDQQGALEVAERLRQQIAALRVMSAGGEVRITSSFGVAMYVARSGAGATLFERADKALYAAKHGGRDRVELAPSDRPWSG